MKHRNEEKRSKASGGVLPESEVSVGVFLEAKQAAEYFLKGAAGMNRVKTNYGIVEGVRADGYTVFKGIPYAAPPVGERRWKLPVPPAAWEGVKICDSFGNICMQRLPNGEQPWAAHFVKEFYAYPEYIPPMSEDCLYLNIWTPSSYGNEKLPVAFWIHGGGFGGGYGSEIEFDGEAYAKSGVILVTINYRCGVFGFLAHPWLSEESNRGISGNYGIFDQIAALNWVYENIAAFGGDPENITIFGQSAGCMSCQVLVSSDLTGNKIKKAILQSGVTGSETLFANPDLKTEERYGERIVKITQVKSLDELRALPAETLLSAKDQFDFEMMQSVACGDDIEGGDFLRIVPCVDGYLLKENIHKVLEKRAMKAIPYIAGCNEDDVGTTDEDRAKRDPGLIKRADEEWCLAQEEAGNPPAYAYIVRHKLPTEDGEETCFHSGELWYSFGTLGRCWRPMKKEDYELSNIMVKAWTNFMKTGNPGCINNSAWRPYTKDDPYTQIFE